MAVSIRAGEAVKATFGRRQTQCRLASVRPSRSACIVAAAPGTSEAPSRREVLGASAAFSLLLAASPAQAFLGFGDDSKLQDTYTAETNAILGKVKDTLAIAKDDPSKEDKVKDLRKDINSWVAKYRREPKVSGRPSFGNTYSALNALAGHYNSFGVEAPIPKKRLERLVKELNDATLLLTRNR